MAEGQDVARIEPELRMIADLAHMVQIGGRLDDAAALAIAAERIAGEEADAKAFPEPIITASGGGTPLAVRSTSGGRLAEAIRGVNGGSKRHPEGKPLPQKHNPLPYMKKSFAVPNVKRPFVL